MEKYYSVHRLSKILGVTAQTIRNWDASGYLKPHHRNKNHRYYSHEQLLSVTQNLNCQNQHTIGYCRVSTPAQKDDLLRQIDNVTTYIKTITNNYSIITDIGSGINYNKKGLIELLHKITNKEVSKIVILYKDRLVRFGFELIEHIAKINGCEIVVIDNQQKSKQEELVEDLMQIITVLKNLKHIVDLVIIMKPISYQIDIF